MRKLLTENISQKLTLIEKAEFEAVDAVFDTLHFAFHPNGPCGGDPDERFVSLWKIFLSLTGWSESDYWNEVDFRSENCECDKCLEKKSSEGEKLSEEKSN